jgi:diguanylate cyclase (GGDEF)-like protein
LGGDEFAVILPHSDRAAAEVVRDRIQQHIAQISFPTPAGSLKLSLSIGAATSSEDLAAPSALIAAADAAMYQAKQASRSQPPRHPAPVVKS